MTQLYSNIIVSNSSMATRVIELTADQYQKLVYRIPKSVCRVASRACVVPSSSVHLSMMNCNFICIVYSYMHLV